MGPQRDKIGLQEDKTTFKTFEIIIIYVDGKS